MAVIKELRQKYRLPKLLNLFGVPRSSYYSLCKEKKDKYEQVKEVIQDIYENSKKRKGYRVICSDLKDLGYKINHKTVLKLMRQMGIKSIVRAKKYSSFRKSGTQDAKVSNVLKRDFSTKALNEKWCTDVTEFKVLDKRIYLSAIMDLCNKEIIGYSISTSPNMKMVMEMIKKAFERRNFPKGVIVHSDQGWHYKHWEYRSYLKDMCAIQSMSKKGNCLDNAVIENFFGTLKCEMFYTSKFLSVEHFISELEKYIYYFNNNRKSQVLGYCTPVDFGYNYMTA